MATNFLDYKVPMSFLQKTDKFLRYHLSLRKVFREVLKWLHIPFYDCSCPEDSGDAQPLQFNSETDVIETYNGTAWVAVTGESVGTTGFTGEIVAVEGTYDFTNGVLTDFTPTP